jgi:hypothetical protein
MRCLDMRLRMGEDGDLVVSRGQGLGTTGLRKLGGAVVSQCPCPYLQGKVELTEERERHIAERHPALLPEHREKIAAPLADPDQSRRSVQFGNAKLFSRWYTDLRQGKHVVVVVVSESGQGNVTGSSQHISPGSWREETLYGGEVNVQI